MDKPQPLAFQYTGANYAPVLMTPIDGHIWELPAGSSLLSGTGALVIPAGAGSVRVESMGAEVRWAGAMVTAAAPTPPTAPTAPTSDVTNGSAGGWGPANWADTLRLLNSAGLPLYNQRFRSSMGVRLTWYAA